MPAIIVVSNKLITYNQDQFILYAKKYYNVE